MESCNYDLYAMLKKPAFRRKKNSFNLAKLAHCRWAREEMTSIESLSRIPIPVLYYTVQCEIYVDTRANELTDTNEQYKLV